MQDIMLAPYFLLSHLFRSADRLRSIFRACKIKHAACGGVTHFALAPDEDEGDIMTIAWGQNASNGAI